MHAALNALSITNRSGTGRYTWGLIHGFVEQQFQDFFLSVFIPANFPIPPAWHNAGSVRFYSVPAATPAERIRWEQFCLGAQAGRIGADLVHSPAFIAPVMRRPRMPQVVTIHDLTYARFPRTIPKGRLWYYRALIPCSLKAAHTVITDSRAVAHEIESLPDPPAHVVPVHLGVDGQGFSAASEERDREILRKYGLEPPYFLFVGTREPRKNLDTLLEAYRRAYGRGLRTELALVGRLGWMQDPAATSHAGVKVAGFAPEGHLPAIYRHALALVAPSWYEGFDLPLLEALACGTPVIAADIEVHREVLGNRAVYVGVQDTEGWAQALIESSGRPKPTAPTRVRDWSDVAAETYMVYLSVCGGKKEGE